MWVWVFGGIWDGLGLGMVSWVGRCFFLVEIKFVVLFGCSDLGESGGVELGLGGVC